MQKNNTIYYFLFVFLIVGAFASMAQHSYGLTLCGIACIGFVLTFLYELITSKDQSDNEIPKWIQSAELCAIAGLALMFVLKNFSIDLPSTNSILGFLLFILLVLIIYQGVLHIRAAMVSGSSTVTPLVLYYSAVVTILLSVFVGAPYPAAGNILTVISVLLTVAFLAVSFLNKKTVAQEETTTAWQYTLALKNKTGVILIGGLLVGVFTLLVTVGTLPTLYRGNMPEGYQHLVDQGSINANLDKALDYKSRFESFVEKWRE